MTTETRIILNDEAATLAAGAALAKAMPAGAIIYLHGDLGAGKTTLMRGVLRGLGHQGKVKSPTYTLVEPYEFGTQHVYHFDLYRLKSPSELQALGMQDYADGQAVCWIEWPDKGEGYLPAADLACFLSYEGEARLLVLVAKTPKALTWLGKGFG
jgi:tRNA threonylcarbamoyladenosine biosynthesis protein TsaE